YFYARDGVATEHRLWELLKDQRVKCQTGSKLDSEWSHFSESLAPNEERLQWIQDRKLIEVLEEQGDPLTEARSVEHWIYFKSADERDSFVLNVASKSFETVSKSDDPKNNDRAFGIVIQRTDRVELEAIHRVVMELIE